MSRRCGHRNWMSHGWSPGGYWYEAPYLPRKHADGVLCLDCRTLLPIGKANDSDERVRVEIRAAELSRRWDLNGDWNGFESLGMVSPDGEHIPLIEADIAAGRKQPRDLEDYLSGHLARVIATHPEGE